MYDLFRICNLCLNDLNLLDEDSNRNIDETIHFVLPELIIVQPESYVRVCPKCLSKISDFYNFKKMCLANNATLWSSVKKVQTLTDVQKLQSNAVIRESNTISEITFTSAVTNNENPNYSLFTSKDDHKLHFNAVKKEMETENDEIVEVSCTEVDTSNENRDDVPLKFEHVEIKSENIDLGETMFYPSSSGETSNYAECESISNDDSSDENTEDDLETISSDTNNTPLLYNMIKQTNTGEFECILCNRLFKRKDNLITHLKIHKNIKDFHCTICGKGFVKREDLKDHMYVHTDTKNFECSVCHAKYSHRVSLTKHMKRHTNCTEEYECSICNKKFTLRGSFVRHMKQHSGIKNFECFVCKRKFDRKHHLDDHLKTHSGVKDFECTVCKKKFAHKSTLKFHMRLHTEIKDYELPERPEKKNQGSIVLKDATGGSTSHELQEQIFNLPETSRNAIIFDFPELSAMEVEYLNKEKQMNELDIIANNTTDNVDNSNNKHELVSVEPNKMYPEISKKKRNKKPEPKTWDKNITSEARMRGEVYVGYKRHDGKVYRYRKEERKMGTICNSEVCKKKMNYCCWKLQEENRNCLFNTFWKEMNWQQRRDYVSSLVDYIPTNQTTVNDNNTSRRTMTYKYSLNINGQRMKVCKKTFLNTLGIKEWMAHNWIKRNHETMLHNESTADDKHEINESERKRRIIAESEHCQAVSNILKERTM